MSLDPTTQQTCGFLTRLPLELRLQIYEHLFRTITFKYGKVPDEGVMDSDSDLGSAEDSRSDSGSTAQPMTDHDIPTPALDNAEQPLDIAASGTANLNLNDTEPDRNSIQLAILSTCRQISIEAKSVWPQPATFSFATTQSLIFFLSKLSKSVLPKIRLVDVKAFPIPYPNSHGTTTVYTFIDFLPFFPGLQLDILTAHDCYHDPGVNDGFGDSGTYNLVRHIMGSKGWKELQFYSPTSEFLGFGPPTVISAGGTGGLAESERWPQPHGWQKVLLERDGQDSGSCVKIYRAKEARAVGKDGSNCAGLRESGDEYVQPPLPTDSKQGLLADATLSRDNEREKEVLVVAKRGRKVDYKEDGLKLAKDFQTLRKSTTWEVIREKGLFKDTTDDPCAWL